MSNRENDDEIDGKSVHQKPNDGDPNEIAVAPLPPILKLNAICCDDLFEWLSIKDLYSLGRTCKRMQRLAGLYFQENFKETKLNCSRQNIYFGNIQFNEFIQFVQNVRFQGYHIEDNVKYIAENCDSLREVSFEGVRLTKDMVDCIKDKLDKVETIHFHSNDYSAFLSHADLLTFLPNLKTLHNERACSIQDKWLYNHYPKLERLMFNSPGEILTDTIGIFFDKNPQLQSFQTDHRFLLKNSDTFLKSNMKLDVLSIRYELNDGLNGVCSLLSKLYDNGFYKRLEFDSGASKIPQDGINRIGRLGGLEKWSGCFEGITVIPAVANLKKLRICDASLTRIDLDAMIDSFPNLHQVRLYEASNNKLLPFIRRLPKMSELSVRHFFAENGHEIDLPTLNGARKQLAKPSKLTIYVEENVYLGTKMATKNLYVDHNLIEVKRVGNIQEDFFADR